MTAAVPWEYRLTILGAGMSQLLRAHPGIAAILVVSALVGSTVALDAQPTGLGLEGIYSDKQANRGSVVYHDVCETCHAPDLSGGKVVPELVGGAFTVRWAGMTVEQLFEWIVVSMPVENPSSVSRPDKLDILAFILSANGLPSGDQELVEREAILDRVAFETAK